MNNNNWKIYEIEKQKLIETCKTSEEYEKAIKELCKKLNI